MHSDSAQSKGCAGCDASAQPCTLMHPQGGLQPRSRLHVLLSQRHTPKNPTQSDKKYNADSHLQAGSHNDVRQDAVVVDTQFVPAGCRSLISMGAEAWHIALESKTITRPLSARPIMLAWRRTTALPFTKISCGACTGWPHSAAALPTPPPHPSSLPVGQAGAHLAVHGLGIGV